MITTTITYKSGKVEVLVMRATEWPAVMVQLAEEGRVASVELS